MQIPELFNFQTRLTCLSMDCCCCCGLFIDKMQFFVRVCIGLDGINKNIVFPGAKFPDYWTDGLKIKKNLTKKGHVVIITVLSCLIDF